MEGVGNGDVYEREGGVDEMEVGERLVMCGRRNIDNIPSSSEVGVAELTPAYCGKDFCRELGQGQGIITQPADVERPICLCDDDQSKIPRIYVSRIYDLTMQMYSASVHALSAGYLVIILAFSTEHCIRLYERIDSFCPRSGNRSLGGWLDRLARVDDWLVC